MELLIVGLLYGGGMAVAGGLLLFASLIPRGKPGRLLLSFLAILALVAQGGCWRIAGGIGKATGGGDDKIFPSVLAAGSLIAALWIMWLLVPPAQREPKEDVPKEGTDAARDSEKRG